MKNIVLAINNILSKFNLRVTKQSQFESMINSKKDIAEILNWPQEKINEIANTLKDSESQLHQDLFVLAELDFKKNGFFVEFGATNGKVINNTYLLEKKFNWKGILAEPAQYWHQDLTANRNCIIEKRCVWKKSGDSILFSESEDREFSSISKYHKAKQKNEYKVETISLLDLLKEHNAPHIIDYLSIDTEGSELEILEAFDFTKYKFSIITCEHNYSSNREKIASLLQKHGYTKKFEGLSQFDDWYVLS